MINYITLLLYIIINSLFVEKYASRVVSFHWWLVIAYVVGVLCVVYVISHRVSKSRYTFVYLVSILITMACVALGLQYTIDPLTLNVDRWSAIHNFLSGMLDGQYPYGQQTHLGGYGSPFPVWQIVHLPFYCLGNVGLSIIVVTLLFLWTLNRLYSAKVALVAGALLLISPAFWYEVAVRSDLLTNIMLSAIIVEWLVSKKIQLTNNFVWIGVLIGAMLSTRLVAIIPICVIYGYEFLLMNWKKQCLFIVIAIAVFCATMLPFLLWEGSTLLFFEYNPFVLQTRQGSWLVLLIFACLAVGVTIWQRGQLNQRLATTGLLLTTLVTMAFVEKMWQHNQWTELFSSTFDITYLSVALPFYVTYLAIMLTKDNKFVTSVSNS